MTGSTNILIVLFIIVFTNRHFDFAACSNSRCREIEWQALMDFKGSLIDEGNLLSSWTGWDCCSWYGITCHSHTGFVQMIDIGANYSSSLNMLLGGHINSSLLRLEHLEHLDLSFNYFQGIQIPPFLGSLGKLQYLNLWQAGFSGEYLNLWHLGNLTNLHHLSVGDYELSSKSLKWVTKLSSLRSLKLTDINFSEAVDWWDSINMLSSLSSLTINERLAGMSLSHDLNLTSLVSIDLSYNNFNSSLPPIFFNLSSLEDIKIRVSGLQGPIPDMFQKLTSLHRLDLSLNSFSSSLPNSLCTLTDLTYLGLNASKIQGSIPLCLGNLANLKELSLEWNELNGAIPVELGSLTQLNQLDLSDNQLSGRFPSVLGKLPKLQRLDISNNSLTGEVSESNFEGLKSLESLDISRNYHIVFNVSPQWIPVFKLEELKMESVSIGLRSFPVWLQTQTSLRSLSLGNSSISSVIPDWCNTSYPYLQYFDLSRNFLTGTIPTFSLINKATLKYLDLSSNRFTGNIPNELCNFRLMEYLELANNQLLGRIPSCMGNLRDLGVLGLANNRLFGHIPYELGYLNQLYALHLNGNKVSGELPSSLQNLTNLITLDLGGNELHGSIPNWIGKAFVYLEHVMLQSNKFSGKIPLNLCQLPSILILNLPDNSLIGTIPPCLGNMSKMLSNEWGLSVYPDPLLSITIKGIELEYSSIYLFNKKFISLSGNQLHGDIPGDLMDLIGLQSLNLSNNKLTGNIPERIGNMKHLESLDLSMNHLSGTIPQGLIGIDTLGYLNLSFNNSYV